MRFPLPFPTSALSRFAGISTRWPPAHAAGGAAWLALMVVVALGADLLPPYSITAFDLKARLAAAARFGGTFAHPLGTDELGRDVLSRLIMSIRMSLLIALFGTLIATTLGTALGFLAAHFRRNVETLILMADRLPGQHAVHDHRALGAGLLRQQPAAVHRPDGLPFLGALRPHRPRPDARRQRAGLCRRRAPARRRAGPHLRAAHPAQHRLDPDRVDDPHLSRDHPAGIRAFPSSASACSRRSPRSATWWAMAAST